MPPAKDLSPSAPACWDPPLAAMALIGQGLTATFGVEAVRSATSSRRRASPYRTSYPRAVFPGVVHLVATTSGGASATTPQGEVGRIYASDYLWYGNRLPAPPSLPGGGHLRSCPDSA